MRLRVKLLLGLLAVSLLALAGRLLLLWIGPSSSDDKLKFVDIFVKVLGAGAIAVALWLTYRRIAAAERTAAAALQNARIAEEGQVTERFTRAIDQLTNEQLPVRLGAIHGLQRLAHDSSRDRWPIIEILAGFVRQQTPPGVSRDPAAFAALSAVSRLNPLAETALELSDVVKQAKEVREPDIPFQDWIHRMVHEHPKMIDLRNSNLNVAELYGAHLQLCDLRGTLFQGADLRYADLSVADLAGAVLTDADLSAANLEAANLEEADLRDANLCSARFDGACLKNTDLRGANLSWPIGLTKTQFDSAVTDADTKFEGRLVGDDRELPSNHS